LLALFHKFIGQDAQLKVEVDQSFGLYTFPLQYMLALLGGQQT